MRAAWVVMSESCCNVNRPEIRKRSTNLTSASKACYYNTSGHSASEGDTRPPSWLLRGCDNERKEVVWFGGSVTAPRDVKRSLRSFILGTAYSSGYTVKCRLGPEEGIQTIRFDVLPKLEDRERPGEGIRPCVSEEDGKESRRVGGVRRMGRKRCGLRAVGGVSYNQGRGPGESR